MSALLAPQPVRRPMAVGDLDAVCAIEAGAYSFPWTRGNFVDSLAAGYVSEVLEAETIIGYFVALPGVDEMHLLNITVATRWQGQGIGSALLEVVIGHARQRRLSSLWLEVRASNVRARALYARRGFVQAGLRRGYYPAAGGREDAILMSLDVTRGAGDDLV
jgi:ribosomal-protein-alanine N-acetyltransferase